MDEQRACQFCGRLGSLCPEVWYTATRLLRFTRFRTAVLVRGVWYETRAVAEDGSFPGPSCQPGRILTMKEARDVKAIIGI